MAELVDALDSKSSFCKEVGVRFPLPAPCPTLNKDSTMKYCSECGQPVVQQIPGDDNRERSVCESCGIVHYVNPKIVVGCVPEKDGRILLCKRAIEPRYGYWTVPAGFMELGESTAQGAARETLEEACAEVEIGHLFASVDVVDAGQVHMFFTARLLSDFAAGVESLDVAMYSEDEIPWDDIAFHSGRFALQKYFEDKGKNNGVHIHELRRSKS
jgi:ADP-ribose pyrophosphatase YjhB (NUDIX family)